MLCFAERESEYPSTGIITRTTTTSAQVQLVLNDFLLIGSQAVSGLPGELLIVGRSHEIYTRNGQPFIRLFGPFGFGQLYVERARCFGAR